MFRRIVCGISGGVDSAISAYLLKQKGFEVVGVYMKNWDPLDESGTCLTGEAELKDARSICENLGIEFHEVSFIKEYWNDVFSSLLHDYENGLTPNPDILCNRFVKFGAFYKYARHTLKADAIATGHYANTTFGPFLERHEQGKDVHLTKPVDFVKDQTFFLSQVEQGPLRRTMFPIAQLYKSQVRDMATNLDMKAIASKKESTGICFIGNRKFSDFIHQYLPEKRGPFIDIERKEIVGWHQGIHKWTLGQRCKIGGRDRSYYVAMKDVANQIIYVSDKDNSLLLFNDLTTLEPHWISAFPTALNYRKPTVCMFKFQHTICPIPSSIWLNEVGEGLRIRLSVPTRAVTPGQFAVLYQGRTCLGSAKICKSSFDTSLHMKPLDELAAARKPDQRDYGKTIATVVPSQ